MKIKVYLRLFCMAAELVSLSSGNDISGGFMKSECRAQKSIWTYEKGN
jgi:hypothetical protein